MEWDFVEYQNKMPFRGIVTGKAIMTMIGYGKDCSNAPKLN